MAKTQKPKKIKPEYSGFWIRFLAYILNNIIQVFAVFIILFIFIIIPILAINMRGAPISDDEATGFLLLFGFPLYLGASILNNVVLVKKRGQDIGKIICGITTEMDDRSELTWGAVWIRYLMKIVFLRVLGGLGALIYTITLVASDKKQSVADLIAKTVIVKK